MVEWWNGEMVLWWWNGEGLLWWWNGELTCGKKLSFMCTVAVVGVCVGPCRCATSFLEPYQGYCLPSASDTILYFPLTISGNSQLVLWWWLGCRGEWVGCGGGWLGGVWGWLVGWSVAGNGWVVE